MSLPENVSLFPEWKDGPGATAADRFRELALMAEDHPEDFARFLVVYASARENDKVTYRRASFGCKDRAERIGLFHMGAHIECDRE